MVVNEGNTNPPASKKADWKIVAGLGVAVIVLGYILFRFFVVANDRSTSNFENTLGAYYKSLTINDTNGMTNFVTADFFTETPELKTQAGKTEVYSYRFENLDQKNNSAADLSTNAVSETGEAVSKITYGVTGLEGETKVGYVLEAYFVLDNGKAKIKNIKKIYKGRNILP